MSFANYLHENFAEITTEVITESYNTEDYYDLEDLFESVKTFKDVPNSLKKALVKAAKKAGENSNVKDLKIQSEGKITTKGALTAALKNTFADHADDLSGFVIEANGVAVVAVIKTSMYKFNLHVDGNNEPTHKDLNATQAITEIKTLLDSLEGGLSAAFKGKGIEVKAVYFDTVRDGIADDRAENKYTVRLKKHAGSELTTEERKNLITKFAKKHLIANVEKLAKELPTLGDTDNLLKASLDREGFEHKQIESINKLLRDVSDVLDAYRWAISDQRIRNFNGEISTYLKKMKKDN